LEYLVSIAHAKCGLCESDHKDHTLLSFSGGLAPHCPLSGSGASCYHQWLNLTATPAQSRCHLYLQS